MSSKPQFYTRVKYSPIPELNLNPKLNPIVLLYGASGSSKSYTIRELMAVYRLKMARNIVNYTIVTDKVTRGYAVEYGKVPVVLRETALNATSSRAHCIYETEQFDELGGTAGLVTLVDLCGNESAKQLNCTRDSPEWSTMTRINNDLLGLRRFIDALAHPNTHIPHRDTVLNTVLYKANLHRRPIICIGTLLRNLDDTPLTETAVGANTNTMTFLTSIGYVKPAELRRSSSPDKSSTDPAWIAHELVVQAKKTQATELLNSVTACIDKLEQLKDVLNKHP